MDKPLRFTADFMSKLLAGEYPETIRVTFGLFGNQKTEFMTSDGAQTKTPFWLGCMSEERMQQSVILELVNPPMNLKGEWKPVFDDNKNVIVKYFPTEEEKERRRKIDEAYEETLDTAAIVASLGS